MWRDELQAWLLVKDSTNFRSFSNLKYEGHQGNAIKVGNHLTKII